MKDVWLLGASLFVSPDPGRLVLTSERLLWFANALQRRELFIARHEIESCRFVESPKFDTSRPFGHRKHRVEVTLKDRTTYRFENARGRRFYDALKG
jgi:hypothetical protein